MPVAQLTDVGLFGAMRRYGDMCMHAVLDLRRTFSRLDLERALAATVRAFPVLGHRYEPGPWRDRWVPVDGPVSDVVHVETVTDVEASTALWFQRPLVPTRDRQVRLVAFEREGKMRIMLSVLHLAVDGAGVAAVGHVLGAHLYGVAPRLPVEQRRDIWRALEGLRWYQLPVLAKGMAIEALRPLRQLAAGPRGRSYGGPVCATQPTFRHLVIPADELERIRLRCGGATVNDVLIAAIARVAVGRSRRGPAVVTYTMDLRRYGSAARLIAANSSSVMCAIVPRDQVKGLAATTASVAAQTARQRGRLAGPAFVLTPYALGAVAPHAFARSLTKILGPVMVDLPLARGLIMTNVGRVDEGLHAFGDDVEDIRILGPNLTGIPVPVVVAFGFRGGLHLDLFAPAGVGEGAVDELADEILAALETRRRD